MSSTVEERLALLEDKTALNAAALDASFALISSIFVFSEWLLFPIVHFFILEPTCCRKLTGNKVVCLQKYHEKYMEVVGWIS